MAPPAFFSMSFWNPRTQEDAPHEGPYHLLWAPPRRLRHTPSPAGAGPEWLPRIVPPARLPSQGWPHGSPGHPQTLPLPSSPSWRLVSIQPHCPVLGLSSPCPPRACAPRPPLPPFPQPQPSLPASSPSQSSPSLPPSPKALQGLPGVWPPAGGRVLHASQSLIPGHASLFSCPSAFAYSLPLWGFPEKSFFYSPESTSGHAQLKFLLRLPSTHSDGF